MSASGILSIIIGVLLTAILGWLLGFRKESAEVELSEAQQAQITLEMALRLVDEEKQFFGIRINEAERRLTELENTNREQAERIFFLEAQIADLRKQIQSLKENS